MDSVSEQRLSQIYPELAKRIRQVADELKLEHIYIRIVQGLRTIQEQDELFAQGRTKPGKIVTNCPGGKSYHNVSLAVDAVPSLNEDTQVFVPDWNNTHPVWKRMIELAEGTGLTCGADFRTFKDFPHFQLTGRFPIGSPNKEALMLYRTSPETLWSEVDKSL